MLASGFSNPVALRMRFPSALEPEPTDGGGGTTLALSAARRDVPLPTASLVPDRVTDGGGGTMLAPREDRREIPGDAVPATPEADGGGGTMLAASPPLAGPRVPEETVGGGGTTSCVPKSLPMMVLTNDPLAA